MFHGAIIFQILLGLCGTAYLANYYGELFSSKVCILQSRCRAVGVQGIQRSLCPTRICEGEAKCCQFCFINATAENRVVTFEWTLLLPEPTTTLVFVFWVVAVGWPCFILTIITLSRVTRGMTETILRCTRVLSTVCLFSILIALCVGTVYSMGSLVIDHHFHSYCTSALTICVGWSMTLVGALLDFMLFLWPAVRRRRKRQLIYDRAMKTSDQKEAIRLLIKGQNYDADTVAGNNGLLMSCCRSPFQLLSKILFVLTLIWWSAMCVYVYAIEKRRFLPFFGVGGY